MGEADRDVRLPVKLDLDPEDLVLGDEHKPVARGDLGAAFR